MLNVLWQNSTITDAIALPWVAAFFSYFIFYILDFLNVPNAVVLKVITPRIISLNICPSKQNIFWLWATGGQDWHHGLSMGPITYSAFLFVF